jgi:hypothetical protein
MAYPAGIITRPVTFGPAFELEDGEVAGMTVAFKATRPGVLWTATGSPAVSVAIVRNADDGVEQTVNLPVTNQDGWSDGDGNAIIPGEDGHVFLYSVEIVFMQGGRTIPGAQPRKKTIAVPMGDGPLDLDSIIPLTSPGGTVVSVPDIWSGQVEAAQAAAEAAAAAVLDSAAFVGSEIARAGSPAEASVAVRIGTMALGASNGTDDTSALNAMLTLNAGKVLKGNAGQTYKISAPLVLRSDTTLDMTGCKVVLIAGSNCNMLQNRSAVTAVRSVTDGATTLDSTTLTSATANFTSADVGRSVAVNGASSNPGGGGWGATIVSVTNTTTVVLDGKAGKTATGCTVSIHNRDSNIALIGGTWDHGYVISAATPLDLHITRWRRVDGLRIRGARMVSTGGKFAFSIAHCDRFWVQDIDFANASDGVHVMGPATRGTVTGLKGSGGDDIAVLGAGEYPTSQDVSGDITDMLLQDIQAVSNFQLVKVFNATTTQRIGRITIRNVKGKSLGASLIDLGSADASGTGNIDEILIEDVVGTPAAGGSLVVMNGVGFGDVTCRGLRIKDTVDAAGVSLNGVYNTTVESLTVDDISARVPLGKNRLVYVPSGSTVKTLRVSNTHLEAKSDNSGGQTLTLSGTVTRAFLTNAFQNYGDALVSLASGAAVFLTIRNAELANGYIGVAHNGAGGHDLTFDNIKYSVTGGFYRLNSTGTATVRWGKMIRALGTLVARSASQTFRSVDAPVVAQGLDLSWTASQQAGDLNFNNNAALACGAGLCLYNGTNWKNLYTGATL